MNIFSIILTIHWLVYAYPFVPGHQQNFKGEQRKLLNRPPKYPPPPIYLFFEKKLQLSQPNLSQIRLGLELSNESLSTTL